ncbi:MAG TPA: KTSC domain-containing protein [Stellaceae bacterium]|nr:KTSC domain-containing protein [Stellaceae bacterium]
MVDYMTVISGNIQAVGWDGTLSTLYVKFKAGTQYAYVGVPKNIFEALLKAPSKGKFFAKYIRDKYPTRRVG